MASRAYWDKILQDLERPHVGARRADAVVQAARAGYLQADEWHRGAADRQRRAGADPGGARRGGGQAAHVVEPKGGLTRPAARLTPTAMSITIDELQATIPAWVGLLLSMVWVSAALRAKKERAEPKRQRQARKRAEDAQAARP